MKLLKDDEKEKERKAAKKADDTSSSEGEHSVDDQEDGVEEDEETEDPRKKKVRLSSSSSSSSFSKHIEEDAKTCKSKSALATKGAGLVAVKQPGLPTPAEIINDERVQMNLFPGVLKVVKCLSLTKPTKDSISFLKRMREAIHSKQQDFSNKSYKSQIHLDKICGDEENQEPGEETMREEKEKENKLLKKELSRFMAVMNNNNEPYHPFLSNNNNFYLLPPSSPPHTYRLLRNAPRVLILIVHFPGQHRFLR